MVAPEEAILKPKNPLIEANSDDWPVFILRNVRVTDRETGELANLLSANKRRPVTVIGQLDEIEDDDLQLVRVPDYYNVAIEIRDVVMYSFGELADHTYGVWAAGKAGWFDIDSPNKSYAPIFKQMMEELSLFYAFANRLRQMVKAKTKYAQKDPESYVTKVCAEYLSQVEDPKRFADVEDVREALHEHREFIIKSMWDGCDALDWIDTPLMKYFKLRFPDDVKRITKQTSSKPGVPGPQQPTNTNQAEEEARKRKSTTASPIEPAKKRRGRPPKSLTHPQAASMPKEKQAMASSEEDTKDLTAHTRKEKSFLRPTGTKSAKKFKSTANTSGAKPVDDHDGSGEDKRDPSKSPFLVLKDGTHLDKLSNPHLYENGDVRADLNNENVGPRFKPLDYTVIRAEKPIPIIKPQVDDTWTCELAYCRRSVRNVSTPEGQRLAREHKEGHAPKWEDADDKVAIVRNESRPYLPTNNLMRHLVAHAPDADKPEPRDSVQRIFERPIRRIF